MREMEVRLRFDKHCLGQVRRFRWKRGKRQVYYLLPRNADGSRVTFMPSWWHSILSKAAAVLCRHQDAVRQIRFGMEVDGSPRPVPEHFFRCYAKDGSYTLHEAFYPGDEVRLTCLVPESIPDEDFYQLMVLAGKYYGISPARANEYGFFTVISIRRRTLPAVD